MPYKVRIALVSCFFSAALHAAPVVEDRVNNSIETQAVEVPRSALASDTTPSIPVPVATPTDASVQNSNTQLFELFQQLQILTEETQRLNGEVEQLRYELEQARSKARTQYVDLDSRINTLAAQPTLSSESATSESNPVPIADPAPSTVQSEKSWYNANKQIMLTGQGSQADRFPKAIAGFKAQLLQYPDGHYAPYAKYWLGELYMALQPADLEQAKSYLESVLKNHPNHSKHADATYKLAVLSQQQGDVGRAKLLVEKVLRDYPNSRAAGLAQKLQQQLN